jgi:hypothetical protein
MNAWVHTQCSQVPGCRRSSRQSYRLPFLSQESRGNLNHSAHSVWPAAQSSAFCKDACTLQNTVCWWDLHPGWGLYHMENVSIFGVFPAFFFFFLLNRFHCLSFYSHFREDLTVIPLDSHYFSCLEISGNVFTKVSVPRRFLVFLKAYKDLFFIFLTHDYQI